MSAIDTFREKLGESAKDIKLNLSAVLTPEGAPGLSQTQIYGTALACAYSTRDRTLVDAVATEAASSLSDAEREASKLAASLMAMNNVYYRATHLMGNENLKNLPARLRMNGIAKPGIDKKDFELYCLGVSAVNGCGMCMTAHEKELQRAGISLEGIQSALRIASVVNAAAQANFIL